MCVHSMYRWHEGSVAKVTEPVRVGACTDTDIEAKDCSDGIEEYSLFLEFASHAPLLIFDEDAAIDDK